jgi:cell division protein FtsZ
MPVAMEAAEPVYYADVPEPVMAPPIEVMVSVPVAPIAAPAPAPIAASTPMPVAAPAAAPAPAPQKPMVDENDWRVSRPATRPAVRAGEPMTRPVARPAAGESRAPNLFQRITGAFSAPKTASAPMAPVDPSMAPRAPMPENVVAVAPKPAPKPVAQPSMNLDVTERAKPARDDDDLQIPAFLRRQAN